MPVLALAVLLLTLAAAPARSADVGPVYLRPGDDGLIRLVVKSDQASEIGAEGVGIDIDRPAAFQVLPGSLTGPVGLPPGQEYRFEVSYALGEMDEGPFEVSVRLTAASGGLEGAVPRSVAFRVDKTPPSLALSPLPVTPAGVAVVGGLDVVAQGADAVGLGELRFAHLGNLNWPENAPMAPSVRSYPTEPLVTQASSTYPLAGEAPLADGDRYDVVAIDLAGNVSSSATFVVDYTPPAHEVFDVALATTIADDGVTGSRQWRITASDPRHSGIASIELVNLSVAFSTTASLGGEASGEITFKDLPNGDYWVITSDLAGNRRVTSVTLDPTLAAPKVWVRDALGAALFDSMSGVRTERPSSIGNDYTIEILDKEEGIASIEIPAVAYSRTFSPPARRAEQYTGLGGSVVRESIGPDDRLILGLRGLLAPGPWSVRVVNGQGHVTQLPLRLSTIRAEVDLNSLSSRPTFDQYGNANFTVDMTVTASASEGLSRAGCRTFPDGFLANCPSGPNTMTYALPTSTDGVTRVLYTDVTDSAGSQLYHAFNYYNAGYGGSFQPSVSTDVLGSTDLAFDEAGTRGSGFYTSRQFDTFEASPYALDASSMMAGGLLLAGATDSTPSPYGAYQMPISAQELLKGTTAAGFLVSLSTVTPTRAMNLQVYLETDGLSTLVYSGSLWIRGSAAESFLDRAVSHDVRVGRRFRWRLVVEDLLQGRIDSQFCLEAHPTIPGYCSSGFPLYGQVTSIGAAFTGVRFSRAQGPMFAVLLNKVSGVEVPFGPGLRATGVSADWGSLAVSRVTLRPPTGYKALPEDAAYAVWGSGLTAPFRLAVEPDLGGSTAAQLAGLRVVSADGRGGFSEVAASTQAQTVFIDVPDANPATLMTVVPVYQSPQEVAQGDLRFLSGQQGVTVMSVSSQTIRATLAQLLSTGKMLVGEPYFVGPEGQSFSPPATVSMRYSPAQLAALGLRPDQVAVYQFTPGSRFDRLLGQQVGPELVAARVPQLHSYFGVFADTTPVLQADVTPPQTSLSVSGLSQSGSGGLQISSTTLIVLGAVDPNAAGFETSGVDRILYALDGAGPVPYAGPFTVPSGDHTLQYAAVDRAGNQEALHALLVSVSLGGGGSGSGGGGGGTGGGGGDVAAPVTTLNLEAAFRYVSAAGEVFVSAPAAFTLAATDEASGIERSYYAVDPSSQLLALGLTAETASLFAVYGGTVPLSEGAHGVAFGSLDRAGHYETLKTTEAFVDATAPAVTLSSAGGQFVVAAEDPVVAGAASGVRQLFYLIDGDPQACQGQPDPQAPPGTCANPVYGGPFALAPGAHTVHFGASDQVDNLSLSSAAVVIPSPEPAPLALAAVAPSSASNNGSLPLAVAGSGFQPGASLALVRPGAGSWSSAGSISQARLQSRAFLLPSGKAFSFGGGPGGNNPSLSTDLFDPATNVWSPGAPMAAGHFSPIAAQLPDGRILAVGGYPAVAAAELYDPASNSWSSAGALPTGRFESVAVTLPDGHVLVAGGSGASIYADAHLYAPASNAWSPAASMSQARASAAAVLLPNGKVLVSGGFRSGLEHTSCELYDPASNTWSAAASMSTRRYGHTLTMLADGKVLAAGGPLAGPAEVYDPASNTWTPTGPMPEAHIFHRAQRLADGRVIVVGGASGTATAVYDPAANSWSAAPPTLFQRAYPGLVTLPDGRLLLIAGYGTSSALSSTELLGSPSLEASGVSVAGPGSLTGTLDLAGQATGYWSVVVTNPDGRQASLANGFLVHLPPPIPAPTISSISPDSAFDSGPVSVSVAGTGFRPGAALALTRAALGGDWTPAGDISQQRLQSRAFLLPSGKAFSFGGGPGGANPSLSTDLYDPVSNVWSLGPPMARGHFSPGAAQLSDGRILAVGGYPAEASAELYDPVSNSWSSAGALPAGRSDLAAVTLADGRVLVAGGSGATIYSDAYLYDAAANAWTAAPSMAQARSNAAGIRLAGGKVLVCGGFKTGLDHASCELYDPAADSWSAAAPMGRARYGHTLTMLADGRVLAAGGPNLGPGEVYDPAAGTWSDTGPMPEVHLFHRAQRLADGRVMVVGGATGGPTAVYDPGSNAWSSGPPTAFQRAYPGLVTLPDGRLLVIAGYGTTSSLASTEILGAATRLQASGVVLQGSTGLTGSFELAGQAPGAWSVVVSNSDGQSSSLVDGFVVLKADLVAPAAVTDLAATEITTHSARLSWTAPGDDGMAGVIAGGELAVYRSTDASVSLSAAELHLPFSGAPGSAQALALEGLLPGATYAVALWTRDEAGNASASSNLVFIRTLALVQSPDAVASMLSEEGSASLVPVPAASQPGAYGVATQSQGLGLLTTGFYEIAGGPFAFDPPAVLSFVFSASGVDLSQVAIYWFDGVAWDSAAVTSQTLTDLGGGSFRIEGLLAHASLYAVFERRDSLPPRTSLSLGEPQAAGEGLTFISPATPVTVTSVDDLVVEGDGRGLGVARQEVAFGTASLSFANTAPAPGEPFSSAFRISLPDGLYALGFKAVDVLGRAEAPGSASLAVDGAAPVSTATLSGATHVAADGRRYVSTATLVALTASDGAGSGVARVEVALDSGAAAAYLGALALAEGPRRVTHRALDRLGNAEAARTLELLSDGTPPQSALSVGEPRSAEGGTLLVSSRTPLSVESADPESGGVASGLLSVRVSLDGTLVAARPFFLSGADGPRVVAFQAEDNVGNPEPVQTRVLELDATPPAVALEGAAGVLAAVQGKVSVRGSVADAHLSAYRLEAAPGKDAAAGFAAVASGSAPAAGQLALWDASALSGWHTLRLWAIDRVGNEASTAVSVFVGEPARSLVLGDHDTFTMPEAVSAGPDGRILVADTGADRVLVFSSTGALLSSFGGFHKPSGVAAGSDGSLYVSDTGRDRVVRLSAAGDVLQELGGKRKSGKGHEEGERKRRSLLKRPAGVALGADGRVVVADAGHRRLAVFDAAGTLVLVVPLPGGGEDEESGPWGVAVDGDGRLYASDPEGSRVLVFDAAGSLLRSIPVAGRPHGLAVSPSGAALFVSERQSGRILRFDAEGRLVLAFGAHGKIHDGKPLPKALVFNKPMGLSLAGDGGLLVADRNNDRVQLLSTPGAATLVVPPQEGKGRVAAAEVLEPDEGGKVERDDKAGVSVPPGALKQDTKIAVAAASSESEKARSDELEDKGLKPVSAPVEFTPHGTRFDKPVTLVLPYNEILASAQQASLDSLAVNYWNEGKKEWEPLESKVDKQAKTVSAKTAHFSLYQVLGSTGGTGLVPQAADESFGFRAAYVYPNPARGGAVPVFHVAVGVADRVKLRVLDVAGREVHSAALEGRPAVVDDGSGPRFAYEHAWEGRIPSGVYLYIVEAEKAGAGPIRKAGKFGVVR